MAAFTANEDRLRQQLIAFKIFEGTEKAMVPQLVPFIRHLDLSLLDYMTIRDLIEFSDCRGDIPLIVVLMAMFAGLQEGSLCLNLDQKEFLSHLPADHRKTANGLFGDFLTGLAAGRYQKLIARNDGQYLPLILDATTGRNLLYFQKYHVHEKRLKARVEVFLSATTSIGLPDRRIDTLLDEIYTDRHAIRVGSNNAPIAKDFHQIAAIRLALKSQFSIISGGPGTGKTSLMVNILRCLVREGIPMARIILGAPTGRAAQRMTETVQHNIASIQAPTAEDAALLNLKGSTLHKILGYRSYQHAFYYRKTNPLPACVVVVDEVSMVDVVMLDNLLQAIEPARTKLVLLGDKHQLPSVEAGAVFAEMIPDGNRAARFEEQFAVLEKVYRSGSNLLVLANQANQGLFPSFKAVGFDQAMSLSSDQWAFVDAGSFGQWRADLHQWISAQYLGSLSNGAESYAVMIKRAGEMTADTIISSEEGILLLDRIFAVVQRARILSFLRNGMYGCTLINDLVADYLIPLLDPVSKGQSYGFSGALVIITRNDYSKDLFNGDVGVIIKDADSVYRAFFHRSGKFTNFPVSLLPSWEFAFAMTVHKSQGSEFDDVLLVLPDDQNHRLLSREIVYTGITRAKKRVLLYGSRPALLAALQRKIQRQSGLVW
ncbi:MAG: exodeoxyribonuclease V subunit alpha [Desulfobacterales bacterium]|jgi:exodeoxyribonuclease V alpha subunit